MNRSVNRRGEPIANARPFSQEFQLLLLFGSVHAFNHTFDVRKCANNSTHVSQVILLSASASSGLIIR